MAIVKQGYKDFTTSIVFALSIVVCVCVCVCVSECVCVCLGGHYQDDLYMPIY